MIIKKAEFVTSSTKASQCPPAILPEFAFIGRSNVGKSSLINMLTGNKALAKISATPGKTQLINHFRINDNWYLVDLPGYGYARTSKTNREGFVKIINDYLTQRESLTCLFVLLDIRLEPQAIDLSFIRWLGENQVPFVLVFTKSDKLGPMQKKQSVEIYSNELLKEWENLPRLFVSSAKTDEGKEQILNFISSCLKA
jgi:GTP-binding protein